MSPDSVIKCEAKRSIADYSHRRPKMAQKKEGIDRHRQHLYHGLRTTNVTKHLGCNPPSHSYSPALQNAPLPSYHRKSSSITENVLGAVHVKRFDPSLPDEWHNRQATDVTEQLRFVPPAHAMGLTKPEPWYGRSRTYVTNPDVDDYSMYQLKRNDPKQQETQQGGQALTGKAFNVANDEPEEKWEWNDGQKIYYPDDGSCPYSQNWVQEGEIETGVKY